MDVVSVRIKQNSTSEGSDLLVGQKTGSAWRDENRTGDQNSIWNQNFIKSKDFIAEKQTAAKRRMLRSELQTFSGDQMDEQSLKNQENSRTSTSNTIEQLDINYRLEEEKKQQLVDEAAGNMSQEQEEELADLEQRLSQIQTERAAGQRKLVHLTETASQMRIEQPARSQMSQIEEENQALSQESGKEIQTAATKQVRENLNLQLNQVWNQDENQNSKDASDNSQNIKNKQTEDDGARLRKQQVNGQSQVQSEVLQMVGSLRLAKEDAKGITYSSTI